MAFVGKDHGAFVAAQLRAVLLKAEARDPPILLHDAFREWDTDGGGTISAAELEVGGSRPARPHDDRYSSWLCHHPVLM